MDLKCNKNVLTKLLARVTPACGVRSSMPILKCLLLRAEANGTLTALGTDLTVSVSASATTEVKKPGEVAVDARTLGDIAKNLPAGDVALQVKDHRLLVKIGKAKFGIPCVGVEDFPTIPARDPNIPGITMPSNELASLLRQASYAHSLDETRPHLACVRLEIAGGEARVVATDGHRLALAKTACAGSITESIGHKAVPIIAKLCSEFGESQEAGLRVVGGKAAGKQGDRSGASVSISLAGGYLHFAWPGLALAVRRVDEQFPPYSKVIPSSYAHSVQVPRDALSDAIKRASVSSEYNKSKTRGVRLDMAEGVLRLSAESSDRGESSDEVDVSYAGPLWQGAAASSYLLDALAATEDDDVLLRLSGALDPIVIVGAADESAATHVIMPLRR